MKKILITGKDGQVGWELQRTLAPHGHITAFDRHSLDLQHPDKIRDIIRELKPVIIVNSAAYTAVDKAETDLEVAKAVNGTAPGILAEEAKRLGALLVHYSTDYVFDGTSSKPYLEIDATNPLNAYGKTKLDGEKSIQAVGGNYLIFRTSWVYGMRGKNFLLTMLRLAKEKEHLSIVGDQIGAPTWSRLIAEATAAVLANRKEFGDVKGIYNLTSAGSTSWYGFADAIFKHCEGSKKPNLKEITTADYPLPAKRPQFSVLSHDKLKSTFRLTMPHWEDSLKLCLCT